MTARAFRKGRRESEGDLVRGVLSLRISPAGRLVGVALATMVGSGGTIRTSTLDLSVRTGLSVDAVLDGLSELAQEGGIVRFGSPRRARAPERRDRGSGKAGGRPIAPRGAGGAE
jgi:hypothetical protein